MSGRQAEDFAEHEVVWTPEKVSNLWNYYGSEPAYHTVFFAYRVGRRVARFIDRRIKLRRMRRILDFGCGRGDMTAALLQRAGKRQQLYGLDFSEKCVAEVEARFSGTEGFAGAERLPSAFDDDFFDLVVATEVVEHLDDQHLDQMLRDCHRMLRPGGFLVVTTPNDEDLPSARVLCPDCGGIFHPWQHMRSWTESSLRAEMEAYGFESTFSAAVSWGPLAVRWATLFKLASKWSLVYFGRKSSSAPGAGRQGR
jgi:2-polyprenyl-3-methyl-5-hydroxy-6-metoxy-1,4-benzoquinol methylase